MCLLAELSIKYSSTDSIIAYVNNSRTHSESQVAQIAASIKEFGFTNPLLIDEDSGIIAGHGRLLAAKKLSLDQVPTITLQGLTEAQRKAYVIADNQLALNAGWDLDLLKIELKDIDIAGLDLMITGLSIEELDGIFFEPDFSAGSEDEQGQLDQLSPKIVECPHCGGEWDLREHGKI